MQSTMKIEISRLESEEIKTISYQTIYPIQTPPTNPTKTPHPSYHILTHITPPILTSTAASSSRIPQTLNPLLLPCHVRPPMPMVPRSKQEHRPNNQHKHQKHTRNRTSQSFLPFLRRPVENAAVVTPVCERGFEVGVWGAGGENHAAVVSWFAAVVVVVGGGGV